MTKKCQTGHLEKDALFGKSCFRKQKL